MPSVGLYLITDVATRTHNPTYSYRPPHGPCGWRPGCCRHPAPALTWTYYTTRKLYSLWQPLQSTASRPWGMAQGLRSHSYNPSDTFLEIPGLVHDAETSLKQHGSCRIQTPSLADLLLAGLVLPCASFWSARTKKKLCSSDKSA